MDLGHSRTHSRTHSRSPPPLTSAAHQGMSCGDRMDMTFTHDTVLSDVHMLQPRAHRLMTRLNRIGQPVFISKFQILSQDRVQDQTEDPDSSEEQGCPVRESPEERGCPVRESPEERGSAGGPSSAESPEDQSLLLDEDGDFELTRRRPRRCERDEACPILLSQTEPLDPEDEEGDNISESADVIRIEHTMATLLEDVGKQVWRGALLLADFILSAPGAFRGATVLELGAGTGVTSILTASVAKRVYCTDVGDDLLSMCRSNISLNKRVTEPSESVFRNGVVDVIRRAYDMAGLPPPPGVRAHSTRGISTSWAAMKGVPLGIICDAASWTTSGTFARFYNVTVAAPHRLDPEEEFSWSEDEVADLYHNTTIIIAADVVYDDDLTDAFFRTLYQLCSSFNHTCDIYISIEKRLNFTLRHMEVCCEAYQRFHHCLQQLQDLQGPHTFSARRVAPSFPQSIMYERVEQLELWKVSASYTDPS